MEARATLRYARISSRKIKIVLDLIRGKDTVTAMAILKNTPKAASEYLVKLLKSAIANAENNFFAPSGTSLATFDTSETSGIWTISGLSDGLPFAS